MVSEKVAQTLSSMRPGTHCALIYDSPENKRDILFNHLRCGQSDSKLVYVCSEEKPEQIRQEMNAFGIDVRGLSGRDRLTIAPSEDVYVRRDGSVNIPGIIDGFARSAWKSSKQGLRAFRACGEMSCFFQRGKVVELVEYERALGKQLQFPAMGICAFNVLEMQSSGCLNLLMPLLRDHGLVILTGPQGAVTLEPERLSDRRVEQVMQVTV